MPPRKSPGSRLVTRAFLPIAAEKGRLAAELENKGDEKTQFLCGIDDWGKWPSGHFQP